MIHETLNNNCGYEILTIVIIVCYTIFIRLVYFESPRMLNTIPPLCTGIGVFFTFLVLYFSLGDVNEVLRTSSDNNKGITLLIDELSKAFTTSIIGILASLVLTPIVRFWIDKNEGKRYLAKPYLKTHPNEFLYKLLEAQKNTLKYNEAQLESLNKAHESIGLLNKTTHDSMESVKGSVDSLVKTFESKLDGVFGSLKAQLETQIDDLSKIAFEETKNFNDEFTTNTKELLTQNINSLSTTLDQNNNHLKDTIGELKTFVETIKGQFSEINTNATEQVSAIQIGIKKTSDEVNKHLDGQAQHLSETVSTINNTMLDLNDKLQGATQKLLDDNLDKLTKSFEQIKEYQQTAQNNLKDITTKFANAVNQYDDFKNNNQEIIDKVNQLLESNEIMTDKNEAIVERWNQLSLDVQSMQNHISDIENVVLQLDRIKGHVSNNEHITKN